MLRITVPAAELYDAANDEFINLREQTLQLEHSLVSLSKWESKWCKPFLSKDSKTEEETIDYIRCMTLTQNVDPKTYKCLTTENIRQVNEYIASPMTATWFNEDKKSKKSEKSDSRQITAELVYYWMIALNIPFECQKWHLNRLLTLIRVCNAENSPPEKKNQTELMNERRALNNARKAQLNTKG